MDEGQGVDNQPVEERTADQFRKLSGLSRILWETLLIGTPVLGVLYILNVHTTFHIGIYPEQ